MKQLGIFHRLHMTDGSHVIRDIAGTTLATCPSRQSAELVMRSLYAKWPIEHVTPEYAEWVTTPLPFGTWPGDETDAELLSALAEIRA